MGDVVLRGESDTEHMRHKAVLLAATGAVAYTVSKIDLAFRGELGMPGFPASAQAYEMYDPVTGQSFNAAAGAVTVILVLSLARLPSTGWFRWLLLAANAVGAVVVGVAVVSFTARAVGASVSGYAAWTALAVGAVWAVSWGVAVVVELKRSRRRPTTGVL